MSDTDKRIAADLLIAALHSKELSLGRGRNEHRVKELGNLYHVIYDLVQNKPDNLQVKPEDS